MKFNAMNLRKPHPKGTEVPADAASGGLRQDLVRLMPRLRIYALSLTRTGHDADDLVQETLLKALANLDKFEKGSNLRAWLFTILKHVFYNEIRHQKYHPSRPLDDVNADTVALCCPQEIHLELKDTLLRLGRLAPEHSEILLLVGAKGLSYEEAAAICHCKIGTVKSRLSRARGRLQTSMDGQSGPKCKTASEGDQTPPASRNGIGKNATPCSRLKDFGRMGKMKGANVLGDLAKPLLAMQPRSAIWKGRRSMT